MSRIRGRDTKPELAIRQLLTRMGYRYRLHARNLPGRPDIVFASQKKAIFVHGCFWHQHTCGKFKQPASNLRFWQEKLQRNVQRDRRNQRALNRAGWKYRVIWECQVKNVEALRKRLTNFLG